MKVQLGALMLFVSSFLFAQEHPPILTADKPKRGIFKTFQEFLMNEPSLQSPFQIVTKSGANKIERGTADYKLLLLDSMKRRREVKKFWGVSDGENIYVNEVLYGGPLNFKKIQGLGRYCYFKGSQDNSGVYASGAAGGVAGAVLASAIKEIDGDYPYVLNVNNGKFYLLTKEILKTILKNDLALLKNYEDGEKRSERNTMLSYIERYNEAHTDEIRYNRPQPISVILYRRQKKERAEAVHIDAGDTIQVALKPNSIEQFTWLNDSLEVCVNSKCKTVALDRKKVNYIECSWKLDQPDVHKVDAKVGEFYQREIRVLNERKPPGD